MDRSQLGARFDLGAFIFCWYPRGMPSGARSEFGGRGDSAANGMGKEANSRGSSSDSGSSSSSSSSPGRRSTLGVADALSVAAAAAASAAAAAGGGGECRGHADRREEIRRK